MCQKYNSHIATFHARDRTSISWLSQNLLQVYGLGMGFAEGPATGMFRLIPDCPHTPGCWTDRFQAARGGMQVVWRQEASKFYSITKKKSLW